MPRVPESAHIGWKLAAMIVAYGLWLAVAQENAALRQLEVPVRIEGLDPALALVGDRPSAVTVVVEAEEGVAKELHPLDISVLLDLAGRGVGSHSLRLAPGSDESRRPAVNPRRPGVKIVEVFPSALRIDLEPKLTARVPVHATISGEPEPGWEVTESRTVPSFVRIVGPESAVKATTAVVTREVSVAGRTEGLEQDVWIEPQNADVEITGTPTVQLSVTIAETVTERTFSRLEIAVLRCEYETRVRPSRVTVTVRGPERLVAVLEPHDVVAYVDLKDHQPQPDVYELDVQVMFSRDQLRQRLEILDITDERVSVRVYDRRVANNADTQDG